MNGSGGKILIRVLLIAGASIIPFLPGLDSPFLFDDLNTLVQNPSIRFVETARFFTDPTAFSVKPGNWPYRPVLLVVNSVQYMLCGLDPFGWHLFQVLIHFINSVLVMVMADKVFRLKGGALFAGLLFALAPIQTQAVIYLSARSMVIACAPALAAVIAIITLNRDESKSTGATIAWTALALIGAALAFFSSEGALALLVWMPIAFFSSGEKPSGKRVWFTLAAIGALAAFFLLARGVFSPGPGLGGYAMIRPDTSVLDHVALQLQTPFFMARLFALPVNLSLLHYASPATSSVSLGGVLAAIGLVAVLAAMVVLRRHRAPVAGLAWYLASLLPAVFVPLNVAWAEHRTYLALPGLVIAAAWCLGSLVSYQKKEGRYLLLATTRVLSIIIIACLGLLCSLRAQQWESARSIFRDAARKAPGYEVPWNFLAAGAHGRGDYEKAVSYLDLAVSLNPNFADAHNTRADCMVKLGRLEEAYKSARRAVELDPANSNYWHNLAVVLMMEERWDDAEAALKYAIERIPPNDPNRRRIERLRMRLKEERRAAQGNNQ